MSLATEIRTFIQQYQPNPERMAHAGPAYTGSSHSHHGMPVPVMRSFLRDALKKHPLDYKGWLAALHELYSGDSLEERLMAGMLLARSARFRRFLPLSLLDGWLGQLEGWNEVDATCQSTFTGAELLARWPEWEAFLRALAVDDNISKRRASLVLLVLPIRGSPDVRILSMALDNISWLKYERDKLISKAISWLLREGSKQHYEAVRDYLETNRADLPAFVVREVHKKLETGKK